MSARIVLVYWAKLRNAHRPVWVDEDGYELVDQIGLPITDNPNGRAYCVECSWWMEEDGQLSSNAEQQAAYPCPVIMLLDAHDAYLGALMEMAKREQNGFRDEDGVWHHRLGPASAVIAAMREHAG